MVKTKNHYKIREKKYTGLKYEGLSCSRAKLSTYE